MISSAGFGLVAKLQENCGSDCINTFSGARLRANEMETKAGEAAFDEQILEQLLSLKVS